MSGCFTRLCTWSLPGWGLPAVRWAVATRIFFPTLQVRTITRKLPLANSCWAARPTKKNCLPGYTRKICDGMTLCPSLPKLTTQQRHQLLRIIARASSPAERACSLWFEPLVPQSTEVLEERRQLWCSAVAGGDAALFEEYLHAR